MNKILAAVFLTISLLTGVADATEEILDFRSAIDIQSDGSLLITESIEIRVEGNQIKHGIYRDFPTRYHDRLGNSYRTRFELIDVRRNGQQEPYSIKPRGNGVRTKIGDANTVLSPGVYLYEIEYRTDRQLGFFDDFDELYFNVTGNGWAFSILHASATVSLPAPVDSSQVKLTGYTGAKGSTEQNLRHSITPDSDFFFETTRPLQPREGLTIVADWPKGIIEAPTQEQLQQQFIDNNRPSLIIGAGVLIVFIYYLLVWLKVGKDPQKGVIYPLYRAPEGFSPASIRFIRQMKYDKSCFTAALINLAVKGLIDISQNEREQYVVQRKPTHPSDLAPGEATIMDTLFQGADRITLTRSEHQRLGKAIERHQKSLRSNYEKLYFVINRKFFVPGMLLSLAFIIWSLRETSGDETVIATVFGGVFVFLAVFLFRQIKHGLTQKNKTRLLIPALIQVAFLVIFFNIASNAIDSMLASLQTVSWPVLAGALLIIILNILFMEWLKAPTLAGRKLLDQIESFELYLKVAESDDIKHAGEPEFSASLYQQFLPYAFALGVEHAWSKRLQSAISKGLTEQQNNTPEGLMPHQGYSDISNLSDTLSSGLDAAISSASTPPGSSSGASGGSSGGGGGGGGGGGW